MPIVRLDPKSILGTPHFEFCIPRDHRIISYLGDQNLKTGNWENWVTLFEGNDLVRHEHGDDTDGLGTGKNSARIAGCSGSVDLGNPADRRLFRPPT